MQQVLENLGDLPATTGAKDIDLIFLKGVMESPIVCSLAKVNKLMWSLRPCLNLVGSTETSIIMNIYNITCLNNA